MSSERHMQYFQMQSISHGFKTRCHPLLWRFRNWIGRPLASQKFRKTSDALLDKAHLQLLKNLAKMLVLLLRIRAEKVVFCNQQGLIHLFRLYRNRRWRRRLAGSRVRSLRFLLFFNANLQRHGKQETRRSNATYRRFLQQGGFMNNSADSWSSERPWQNNERTFLSAFVAEQKEKLPNRRVFNCMYSVVWARNWNSYDCQSRRLGLSNCPEWRNHRQEWKADAQV